MVTLLAAYDWRHELPTLSARLVALREPHDVDLASIVDLLSLADATPFGLEHAATPLDVRQLLERARRARAAGLAFTYAITTLARPAVAGLLQVRQLDPAFEAAEWECTLAPAWRGTGVFVEAARLAGSFVFGTLGSHRLEARVPVRNGRAQGALRKLGAVQEGVLRRSMRRDGEYADQALWSVLKEDWGERWISTAPRVH
jgi:RimJ/RimL family protein N-acetyltransferase